MQQASYRYERGEKAIASHARTPARWPHPHQMGPRQTHLRLHTRPPGPLTLVKYGGKKKQPKTKAGQAPLPTWSPPAPLLGAEEFDPGKDV